MIKIDSHNHTTYSHDAVCSPEKLCAGAIAAGLTGLAVTDHADVQDYTGKESMAHIFASVAHARSLKEELAGRLEVYTGMEYGEAVWDKSVADYVTELTKPDVVLSSVHAVRYGEHTESFSRIDFSHWSKNMLHGYMVKYFEDMQEMVETVDMDVLTHLSNPVKYMNGKYGRGVSLEPYADAIDGVLKTVVSKGIALELNLALIGTSYSEYMPTLPIMRRYKELGGELVTIGSDAHVETRIGVNFDKGVAALKECGFTAYNYFKGRKCHRVEFGE